MRPASAALVAALAIVPIHCGANASEADTGGDPAFRPVDVSTAPVVYRTGQPGPGRLRYRGGLVLTSPDSRFGGLSGLGISADGRTILAVTDRGDWFKADLTYRESRLAGLANGRMAPLRGSRAQVLPSRRWTDAEGLTMSDARLDGPVWVSFEQRHRIERYEIGRDGTNTRARRTRLPSPLDAMPRNSGVEALVRFGDRSRLAGALLVLTEHPGSDGAIPGHLIGGPDPGPLWLASPGGYSATDAALLPDGDLVVLERRLGAVIDFSIRIRRIQESSIRPGATLDGEILLEAGLASGIDNMEGIAVHADDGEIRLTLVSDDNFSPLQRTLLLQFALGDEPGDDRQRPRPCPAQAPSATAGAPGSAPACSARGNPPARPR